MSKEAVIAVGLEVVPLYPFMNMTKSDPPPDKLTEPVLNPVKVSALLLETGFVFVPSKFPLKVRITPEGARTTPLRIAEPEAEF